MSYWEQVRKERTWRRENNGLTIAEAFLLQDLGVTEIKVNYSGGGDSGQIDDIEYCNPKVNGFTSASDAIPKEILDRVEKIAYTLLEDIGDWYNNEGGYGTVFIKLPSFEYDIDAHYYEEAESIYNEETGDYDYDYDNQKEWGEWYSGNITIKL